MHDRPAAVDLASLPRLGLFTLLTMISVGALMWLFGLDGGYIATGFVALVFEFMTLVGCLVCALVLCLISADGRRKGLPTASIRANLLFGTLGVGAMVYFGLMHLVFNVIPSGQADEGLAPLRALALFLACVVSPLLAIVVATHQRRPPSASG